jgi:hypothetical protein
VDEKGIYRLGPMDFVPSGDPRTLGERKLIARFLGVMVSDANGPYEELRDDALEWFFREEEDEDDPEPFGLLWCVGALWPDIDPIHMREMFRATTTMDITVTFRTDQG